MTKDSNKELTADLESILIDVCGRYRCEKICKNCRYFMHIVKATEHIKQIIKSECKKWALEKGKEKENNSNVRSIYGGGFSNN